MPPAPSVVTVEPLVHGNCNALSSEGAEHHGEPTQRSEAGYPEGVSGSSSSMSGMEGSSKSTLLDLVSESSDSCAT
jgi:hypothetical protein